MTEQINQGRATLYRKLAAVAGAVRNLPKDGLNPQLKYKYTRPETVMTELKPLLVEQGLAILPMVNAVTKEDMGTTTQGGAHNVLTRLDMTYTIVCGETGESVSLPWASEGTDWGDKGIAKAQTIALRTFLINLFQIPTGDEELDPDARGASYDQPQRKTSSAPTAERTQAPPPRAGGGSRAAPAPARETNGMGVLQEKRAQLAALRTDALRAKITYNPPKSPGDMSQMEVEAAINQLEALMGANLAHAVPVPSEKAALVD